MQSNIEKVIKNLLKNIFSSNKLWSSAIHEADSFNFDNIHLKLKKVFGTRALRVTNKLPHTLADPFLIVKGKALYIFLESQAPNQKGKITAYQTTDLINYQNLGVILEKDFHLSYPFVFEFNGFHYLLPESESAEEVALYKFKNFPYNPTKFKVLLTGRFFDSSLIFYDELWYLFTSTSEGLQIFWSKDLLNADFQPHKKNPITINPKYSRSAGSIFTIDDKLYRPCQDCSNSYGENVNIMEITHLSCHEYAEKVAKDRFFETSISPWNRNTGHHLSIVNFMEKYIIATDKIHNDILVNKFLFPLRKLQK